VHGGAGTFDIDLHLQGPPGVECRSTGSTNDHQIVVTFSVPIASAFAHVIAGTGSVKVSKDNEVAVNGADVTINLTGVANAQTIQLQITGVSKGASFDVAVPMAVLLGDMSNNSSVNSSDVSLTKAQVGETVDASNFRADVTGNGAINASDVAFVKSKSGTSLP
jgi:hypothetical protein